MRRVPSVLLVLVAVAAATALSGCGLRGRLERPVPLWGDPPMEGAKDPRTLKAAREKEEQEKAKKKAEQDAEAAQRAAQQAQPAAPAPMNSTSTPTP